jgi:MraZ protein
MLTRKTQYAWMALGGLICLFGLVLACKLRDGNRVVAQPQTAPPLLYELTDIKTLDTDAPTKIPAKFTEPRTLPPPKKELLKGDAKPKTPSSESKVTLEMPFPGVTSGPRSPALSGPTPTPQPQSVSTPPPSLSTPLMPTAFAPNTPTSQGKKPSPSPVPLYSSPPMDSPKPAPAPVTKSSSPSPKPSLAGKPAEAIRPPSWNAPVDAPVIRAAASSDREAVRSQPGEPPLAPSPGPVQIYRVHGSETLQDIARRTLGSSERAGDLRKLNPALKPDERLRSGTTVRLPADACLQSDDAEPVKPLPALRAKTTAPKAKALPLTGTYQCSLDEKGQLTLPRALRDQLGGSDTVLVSPGPDKCLWLTNQPHLERLGERLEQSHANENDVRVFKRLYFAQTEKLSVNGEGRVAIPERLGQFAGLHQEVVLVGIDDHFEVWDSARWRSYTQQKGGGHVSADVD